MGRIHHLQHPVAVFIQRVVSKRHGRSLGVYMEWILTLLLKVRVVAVKRPVATGNGFLLLVKTLCQVEAVVDAVGIGNDQGWPVIGLSLGKGLDCLGRVGADCHLGYINIAVGGEDHADVFFRHLLASRSKLCCGSARSRF